MTTNTKQDTVISALQAKIDATENTYAHGYDSQVFKDWQSSCAGYIAAICGENSSKLKEWQEICYVDQDEDVEDLRLRKDALRDGMTSARACLRSVRELVEIFGLPSRDQMLCRCCGNNAS